MKPCLTIIRLVGACVMAGRPMAGSGDAYAHEGEITSPLPKVLKDLGRWKMNTDRHGKPYGIPNVFVLFPKRKNIKRRKTQKQNVELQNVACFLPDFCEFLFG